MRFCAFYVIWFYKKECIKNNNNQLAFKGDKGALTGMAAGAAVGLGGAGVGAQVGGIIGGLTSDD